MSYSIGIVGGAVSGLAALRRFVKKLIASEEMKKVSLHLWEQGEITGGPAWSSDNSDVDLFNLPAGVACLELHDFSGPFLKWCAAHGHKGLEFGSYPPRKLFGQYCADFLEETLVLARDHGIAVSVHKRSCVVDIQESKVDSRLSVIWNEDGDEGRSNSEWVDAALLCTGPASLENDVLAHLRGSAGYFPSPWPHPDIPQSAAVGIVGTGLSGVDAVKHLYASGHNGKVVMTSRHGLLPTIKAEKFEPFIPLSVATPEAVEETVRSQGHGSSGLLDAFIDMIKREIEAFQNGAADGSAVIIPDFEKRFSEVLSGSSQDSIRHLEMGLEASKTGKRIPWQDCTIALSIRDVIRKMWSALSDDEKNLYYAKYSALLNIHFNAMPSSSGHDMLRYFREEDCSLKGGLRSTAVGEDGGFDLHFDDSVVHVDYIINAAGFGKHFDGLFHLSVLYDNMLRSEMVKCCKFGGLSCDFNTGRLDGTCRLYAAGHIISGTKMLTSGISYCLLDGAAAVDDILCNLAK